MKLIIEDDEGRKTVVPVVRDEITIGRQDGNTIKLTERNVSRKHARLWKDNGALLIEDLGSYNGVRVNGDKIAEPTPVKEGDLIEIGDYDLGIQGRLDATAPTPTGGAKALPRTPALGTTTPPTAAPRTTPAQQPVTPAAAAATPSAPPPAPTPAPPAAAMPTPTAGGATAIININKLMAQGAPQIEVRDLAKNEMPRLVGLAGAYRGKEFYLMRTEWKVGRTEENDLQIDHQSISRQHGRFALEDDGWKLYDNKSANGVKVNGEEYAVAPIKPGDTLELGHVKFRFCAPGEKFTPPPEKVEGAAAAPSKQLPSAAEMMAGSGKGAPARPAAGAGAPNRMPLIAGVGAVVVIGAALFFLFGRGGGPQAEALAKADAAAKKRDFKTASDQCEAAGEKCPEASKKRWAAEAEGQELHERLEAALGKGDGDVALAVLKKCGSDGSYWCGKVKEKEDAARAAFAKKHLDAARAAKGNDPEKCSEEANRVLAEEAGNAQAQEVLASCSPAPVRPPPPPPPSTRPASEGPSQKDRDAQAARLLASGVDKVKSGDPAGGAADLRACVAKKPSADTLGRCWKNLGVAEAKAGNSDGACKALKQYLNFCADDCDAVKGLVGRLGC